MAYQAPLVMRKKTLGGVVALWLIAHGWQYSVTVNRGIMLATLWEQARHVWTVRSIKRALIVRLRNKSKEPQA